MERLSKSAWPVLRRGNSGAVEWEREVQKIIPPIGAARLEGASSDAVSAILRELFGA